MCAIFFKNSICSWLRYLNTISNTRQNKSVLSSFRITSCNVSKLRVPDLGFSPFFEILAALCWLMNQVCSTNYCAIKFPIIYLVLMLVYHVFVATWLCCHSNINLFSIGKRKK